MDSEVLVCLRMLGVGFILFLAFVWGLEMLACVAALIDARRKR